MNINPKTGRLRKTNLKIWQHNINKSCTCQHNLISSGKLTRWEIDVVALQEPSINWIQTDSRKQRLEDNISNNTH